MEAAASKQQHMRQRTATTVDRRDAIPQSNLAPSRALDHQQRRRRESSTHDRPTNSIQLESAPWLERQSRQARAVTRTRATTTTATDVRPQNGTILADSLYPDEQMPRQPTTATRESRRTVVASARHDYKTTTIESSNVDANASHSTAASMSSVMSEPTRNLLYGKAVKMSHSIVNKAQIMIKTIERSRALANGLRRKSGMEIEGYRFLQVTKAGVAIYEDATAISLEQKGTRMRPRLIGVSSVKATLDEFTDTFGRDSDDGFTLLNPDMHSLQTMHRIAAERERHIGINWLVMQPTWTGSMARRRDFVVLACEETFYTGNQHNRRGWVNMMHSVQLPWCPPLDKSSSIVRGSMYQTGLIVLESEASSEWLHVISVVEIDMKGNVADRSQRANALKRIGCLENIAPTIVKQRLQRMSLMRTKQFNAVKPAKESHCAVCTQRIGIPSLRLHHYCRKCSNSVCGSCSRNWQLDPTTKKKTRVCGLCIMVTQKRSKSTDTSTTNKDSSIVDDDDDEDVLIRNIPSMQRAVTNDRPSRAQMFPETVLGPLPEEFRSGADRHVALQSISRSNSLLQSCRTSSYFDLPMDPSELMTPTSDQSEKVDKSSETKVTERTSHLPLRRTEMGSILEATDPAQEDDLPMKPVVEGDLIRLDANAPRVEKLFKPNHEIHL
ncbi:Arrestin domain-containing protein d, partial [Globisporangium splendens]